MKLLAGAATFNLHEEPSIGLGELRLSDGPTGVRGLKFSGGRTVSLFPNATLLSAAWDEDTAYEVGQLLAEEAMAQEIHVVLGPTINLHRSLLGGRLFEAYSEDPLLSGKLAAAYVRGLQDSGVAACLKHLIANESETERNTVNSVVDEATLRELYLLPFEIAVAESERVVDHGRVQRRERHHRHRAGPRQQRDREGRVGLRRADHVRLVRHQVGGAGPRTVASTWSCPARRRGGSTAWWQPSRPVRSPRRRSTTTCAGCCCWPTGPVRWARRATTRPTSRHRTARSARSSCVGWRRPA